jgi:PhnB protein
LTASAAADITQEHCTMSVSPIPNGYNSVSPYLIVDDANALITFLKATFDAEVVRTITRPGGYIGHADVRIGDSIVMLADSISPMADSAPAAPMLHVYVDDVDATYAKALAAGATSVQEPSDQYYGDRSSTVEDAFGNLWFLATHREDVSGEELSRRAAAVYNALSVE